MGDQRKRFGLNGPHGYSLVLVVRCLRLRLFSLRIGHGAAGSAIEKEKLRMWRL